MQELHLYLDPENFYCPVTGQQIFSLEEFTPSSALLFLYLHEVQEFEYVHDIIKEMYAEHIGKNDEIMHAELLYNKIIEDEFLDKNERILINFGQLSPASMCFDFSFIKQEVK